MIRTNCKRAIENIRKYIIDNFDGSNYEEFAEVNELVNDGSVADVEKWRAVSDAIRRTFYVEMVRYDKRYAARRVSLQDLFFDWCQGLPSILDTCYYYNRSAVDDLGAILEESDAEKSKFSESDAEWRLTWLIYRELFRGCKYEF